MEWNGIEWNGMEYEMAGSRKTWNLRENAIKNKRR